MASGSASCPICQRGEPLDVIARLPASWLTMNQRAPARGYVCVVSAVHAEELHDLPEAVAMQFLRDARKVSQALAQVTGAAKLNYEIHGNTIAHLHMHLYPRYPDDPFVGRPIHPAETTPYEAGDHERLRARLATALAGEA